MDRKARFRQLFDLVGHPRAEVARLLGCSVDTVKSYLATSGLTPTPAALEKMEAVHLDALRSHVRSAGFELIPRRNPVGERKVNISDIAA